MSSHSVRDLRAVDFLGAALAIWGIFAPTPYGLCILALAVAPLVALLIAATSRGAVSLYSPWNHQPRSSLGNLLLLPGLALGLRAGLDTNLIDWRQALVPAVGLGLLPAAAGAVLEPKLRQPAWILTLAAFGLCWGWGVVAQSDVLLDRGRAQSIQARVMGRRYSSGRHTVRYYLTIAPVGVAGLGDKLSVPGGLYARTGVGATVCAWVHGGALGWRWYLVDDCGGAAALTTGGPHAPFRAS
jgi:hypothetical protein